MSIFLNPPNKAYDSFHNRVLLEVINIFLGIKKEEPVIEYGDHSNDHLPFKMELTKVDLLNMICGTSATSASYGGKLKEYPHVLKYNGGFDESGYWNRSELEKYSVNILLKMYIELKDLK